MNITLSIPDDVASNAREYAKKHGTSLNQMVRDHLQRFSREAGRRKNAEEAIAFFQKIVPTIPKDVRITREEMEQR